MRTLVSLLLGLCLLPACSSDDSTGKDQGVDQGADLQQKDTSVGDTSNDDAKQPPDALAPDTNGETEIENPFGFVMRLPKIHTVKCDVDPEDPFAVEEIEEPDTDWICTFEHGGTTGHVYVQSTPSECESLGMSTGAKYTSTGFISIDGKVTALSDVYYDWGGNHRNDEMGFDHDGTFYRYYHSSFGFGWRKCHPMDCIQVLKAKDGETIEDGCTSERTLPVVCLAVTNTSTSFKDADFADTFEKCPGDDSP